MAKETADFDYGYLHDLVVLKLRHMLEFYVAGNNVWQSRESHEYVIKTLSHAVNLAEQIDVVHMDYPHDFPERETELYKEFYSYIGEHIQWWWD